MCWRAVTLLAAALVASDAAMAQEPSSVDGGVGSSASADGGESPLVGAPSALADAGSRPAAEDVPPAEMELPPTASSTAPLETVVHESAQRPVTGWRIHGSELAQRGAETLADALDLLPHLRIRLGGRGEVRFDLRAARPGSIRVLVDGVPMEEPYLGRFDPASVSVSDVVQIRVDPAPLSPVEGPGGGGGVVEVETLSGAGKPRVEARARAGTPLDGLLSATGRHPFGEDAGGRLSATIRGARDSFLVSNPDGTTTQSPIPSSLLQAGLRLQGAPGRVHLMADVAAYDRCYWALPGQDSTLVQRVCSQAAARGILRAWMDEGPWRASLSAYGLFLGRDAETYATPSSIGTVASTEQVQAHRLGGNLRLERAIGPSLRLIVSDTVEANAAHYELTGAAPAFGRDLTLEPAAAAVYEAGRIRGEVSAGAAIPLGQVSAPWAEAKGTVAVKAPADLVVTANVGRKGRVPTLRERFEPGGGNPDLGPELLSYADVELNHAGQWVAPRVGAFYRWMDGLIQLDPATHLRLVNVAHLEAGGFELAFAVNAAGRVSGGAAYGYVSSTQSIENQPAHHGEVYLKLRLPRLGALARLRYVGTRPEGGAILDPYTLLDVSAWYQVTPWLRLTVRGDNLLDVHYQYRKAMLSSGRWMGLTAEVTWE